MFHSTESVSIKFISIFVELPLLLMLQKKKKKERKKERKKKKERITHTTQLTVPNDNPSDAKVRFSVIIYVDMLLDYKGSVSFCNFSHAFNNHELFIHDCYFLFNVHYTVIITIYYVQ